MEYETRKTLALKLKVSQRTVERWEKLGMPVIKIGQIRRYDQGKVNEWLSLNAFSEEVLK
jgi:phage terminase Nu1 subunit (DNA packaging protein)